MSSAQKSLVILTFGTTHGQNLTPPTFLSDAVLSLYPGVDITVAYSSAHVAKVLRANGQNVMNLSQALAELSVRGIKKTAIQSMHVIPGYEYDVAKETAARFEGMPKGIKKITLGLPLIASHSDAELVAEKLFMGLPAERKHNEAVIFVGHGTDHPIGSLAYPSLQLFLNQIDPLIFIGTIDGPFNPEYVQNKIKGTAAGKIWLAPLLTAVGGHAKNDLFGSDGSWQKKLEANGLLVEKIEKGLFEYPELVSIWAKHACAALESLD